MAEQFIILTAEQAERVRYETPGVGGLNPVPAADGTFYLGLRCLRDPQHGEFLATLPRGPLPEPKWEVGDGMRPQAASAKIGGGGGK